MTLNPTLKVLLHVLSNPLLSMWVHKKLNDPFSAPENQAYREALAIERIMDDICDPASLDLDFEATKLIDWKAIVAVFTNKAKP